jgi:hypothetical protein
MLKLCFVIIGLTLMASLITLPIPCPAQHRPILENIFNSTSKEYNFMGVGKVNADEFELGKGLVARQDDPDPPPPPR